jgi:hypothetical protein
MNQIMTSHLRATRLALSLLLALAGSASQAASGIDGLSIDTVVPRLDQTSTRLPSGQTFLQSIANMLKLSTNDWPLSSQDALGAIRVTNSTGSRATVLPVGAQMVDPDRQDGVLCYGNGLCQTVASHIVTSFNATLDDPAVFIAALRQIDPTASVRLNGEGNLRISLAGRSYLAQVSWNVYPSSGGNGFANDGGTLWFAASSGKQALYPVLASLDRLLTVARKFDPAATAQGDHQGKVSLVFNGQQYSLLPAWEAIATPAAHASDDVWVDNGVLYLNYLDGTAQGLQVL